ncbi:unnamed protein product, partial [Didymodactylos carnosus]
EPEIVVYSIFDRQNMHVSLYDELIDTILHIIDRLDLRVEKEKQGGTEYDNEILFTQN